MQENDLIIYKNKDGNIIVDAIYKDETLWLSQKGMSKVFEVGVPAISKHLKKIFCVTAVWPWLVMINSDKGKQTHS